PHLRKSRNPHILNNAPPPSADVRWFAPHVAYSLAKFGMSFCAMAMAEEFRAEGIAVNTLWPKTKIATAAVQNLLRGDDAASGSSAPQRTAYAARAVLTKPSREFTGRFSVAEGVLRAEAVTDFSRYAMVPGAELFPDFFL